MFFWNSLGFSMIQWLLAIWSLVPLPILNPAWTSGKFLVHILLKPGLEKFEHFFASLWDECKCVVIWIFFGIAFFATGMKTDLFNFCGHCLVFQICWHIECISYTASSFRIWNGSPEIPSLPLALFIVMLPKAYLTSHSRMSGSRWVITTSWFSVSWRSFLYSSLYSCHLFLISSISVRSILFLSFIEPIFAWNFPFVCLIFHRSQRVGQFSD